MSSSDPVAEFFSNWGVYRAVIEHDCMEHRDIYAAVGRILRGRGEPFTVLDLGCGDSVGIAPALAGAPVARYTGVDSAAAALAFAGQTLRDSAFEVELIEQDLAETIRRDRTYDVVVMAFALHHFDSARKRRILAEIRHRLNDGGELILIDLVRQPGQSRDQYLDDYEAYVRDWPLASDTIEAIVGHVRGFDHPEQVDVQPRWAGELGYAQTIEFYSGGSGTQRGWRMMASARL